MNPAALSEFHLLRPWWLLALLLLPALLQALGRYRAGHSVWAGAVDPQLLDFLLLGRGGMADPWPARLLSLAWFLAVLALSGPAWQRLPEPVYESIAPRVLILDLSASMLATDTAPSRIARARHKLLDTLKRSREGQVGLVVYAGDAHVIAPLTPDANTVAALVPGLDPSVMPKPGARADRAVAKALGLLKNAGYARGELLLLTDGVAADQLPALKKALSGGHHRLSVLGIGTPEGAPVPLPQGRGFLKDKQGSIVLPKLERDALERLARLGGGQYAELSPDDRDLDRVLASAAPTELKAPDQRRITTDRWADRGPWLLLPLLPLGLLAFRRGWLGSLVPFALVCCLSARPAEALEWRDLWQGQDQQAAETFSQGRHAEAAGQFHDPLWQGSAWYRAGEYDKAAQAFARDGSAEADYNRGNALAQQGRFDEAILAYDRALSKVPDLADAKANRELVQALKQQAQKQQSSSQASSSQDSKQSEGQDGQNDGAEQEANTSDRQAPGSSAAQAGASASQAQEGLTNEPQAEPTETDQPSQNTQAQANSDAKSSQNTDETPPKDVATNDRAQAEHAAQAAPRPEESADASAAGRPGEAAGESEETRALEQWLRKIPDDPGGLLREKLRRESLRQAPQNEEQPEETPW